MTYVTIAKRALLMASLLLVVPFFASTADAQGPALPADILKDGCSTTPTTFVHHFKVRNNSLTRICQVRFIPMAGSTYCPILTAAGPAGWSTTVNPDGSALWVAATAGDCVANGTTTGGFSFGVAQPNNCCYYVEFMNAAGTILYQTTRCCDCGPISVEENSWGRVKALYQ